MIGLILIYFLGKYFYNLAIKHNKSKWQFAILGVVVYYAGTFIGGFLIGALLLFLDIDIDSFNELLLGLLAIPLGLLSAYLLYRYLDKRWSRGSVDQFQDVLDHEYIQDEQRL